MNPSRADQNVVGQRRRQERVQLVAVVEHADRLPQLLLLTLVGGCQAGSSIESAQTAIAVAQTALPGLQTALPGVQATAQAGATLISGVLSDPLAINAQLQALLAGVTIDARTTPDDAP